MFKPGDIVWKGLLGDGLWLVHSVSDCGNSFFIERLTPFLGGGRLGSTDGFIRLTKEEVLKERKRTQLTLEAFDAALAKAYTKKKSHAS